MVFHSQQAPIPNPYYHHFHGVHPVVNRNQPHHIQHFQCNSTMCSTIMSWTEGTKYFQFLTSSHACHQIPMNLEKYVSKYWLSNPSIICTTYFVLWIKCESYRKLNCYFWIIQLYREALHNQKICTVKLELLMLLKGLTDLK